MIVLEVGTLPYLIGAVNVDEALAEGPTTVSSLLKSISKVLRYERTKGGIKVIVVGVSLQPEEEFKACIDPDEMLNSRVASVDFDDHDDDVNDDDDASETLQGVTDITDELDDLKTTRSADNATVESVLDQDAITAAQFASATIIQKIWRGVSIRKKISLRDLTEAAYLVSNRQQLSYLT
jgi:hypothetical protein